VNVRAVQERFSDHFDFLKQKHFGNLAYLFVLNSMVFRVPLWLKVSGRT